MTDEKEFTNEFKAQLIEWLNIEDITPDGINDDAPLFGEGLGLDSLDAVEIVIMLQRKYGIPQKEMESRREIFQSVATLVAFIKERKQP